MSEERTLTKVELQRYDGEDLPMWIAYQGTIYDVSACPHWKNGLHQGLHFPGQDLTDELNDAPHGEEVFVHASIKKTGLYKA